MTLFAPVNTATQEVIESSLRSKFNSLPAADVAPVVRCKECKHYWKNVNTFGYDGVCTTVSDNDFCSHGERKGGE